MFLNEGEFLTCPTAKYNYMVATSETHPIHRRFFHGNSGKLKEVVDLRHNVVIEQMEQPNPRTADRGKACWGSHTGLTSPDGGKSSAYCFQGNAERGVVIRWTAVGVTPVDHDGLAV